MKKGQKFYVDLMQQPARVTGSFNLGIIKVEDKTIKFAVDCGLYQDRDFEEQNCKFPTKPEELDFVILTHNHVDHSGRLPLLVKYGFRGKIYTTKVTKRILGKALEDNTRIMKDTSKRKNKEILYESEDAQNTLNLVEGCEYNTPIRVNENVTITFIPNGHLIGSALVLVQIHCPCNPKDINLLFSGDYNYRNMFFRVAPVRKWITKLPINIIMESTYGYMNSNEIKETFETNIVKAIKEKKTIVVPVFSLGRAQEILYILKHLQKKYPELLSDVKIYHDGKLSFYYTDMYYKLQSEGLLRFYKDKMDFLPENYVRVDDKMMRKDIVSLKSNESKIILTTSGMGSYGPAQVYLPAYIGNPNALIHFTGYCAEGTLGYRLKSADKGEIVEIGGVRLVKQANIEFTNEFSAHAKADEMLNKFLKKFEKPLFVMLNHGEDNSKDVFSDRILRETDVKQVGILGREYFYRIDVDGFVKSVTSKFL